MHRTRWLALPCLLVLLGALTTLHAQAQLSDAPALAVPPSLSPWIPWVLDGADDARCPQVGDARVCVWPSTLSLEVSDREATFALRVTSERERTQVDLPGAREYWPVDVTRNGKPVPVLERAGVPTVAIGSGDHELRGRFALSERLASLHVPKQVGALTLRVNGQPVAHPRREDDGLVWIDERRDPEAREARLTLSVHRRIEDAVPLRVITRIEVSAAGTPRELTLPQVLLAATRPIALHTDLPAQLTPDGRLRLQAQAGSYRVEIVAIAEQPFVELRARPLPSPWPDHEVWVFQADDQLRHVELSGPPQIDPARTDLRDDWRGLPTYMVAPNTPLRFDVRRRGEADPAPNSLTLAREVWLDLDGDGFTVRDRVSGAVRHTFRLDLHAGMLGHATLDGVDALITKRGKVAGVELRRGSLDLATEWRLEHGPSVPAVGYGEDVDALSATLHLPPGFMLLGASGVDAIAGTWFESWDLFDFFFVLLSALAAGRLAGPAAGVSTLAALMLTQHAPDAPGLTWIALLVATALTRGLAKTRLAGISQLLWLVALLSLLLALIPFAGQQLRTALHPQLGHEASERYQTSSTFGAAPAPMEAAEVAAPEGLLEGRLGGAADDDIGGGGVDGVGAVGALPKSSRGADFKPRSPAKKSEAYATRDLLDPSAIVQTGPGLPTWNFSRFSMHWSGPVSKDERIGLWLLPPWATRLWALAATLLSGLVVLLLARARGTPSPPPPAVPPPAPPATSGTEPGVIAPLVLLLLLTGSTAHAQSSDPPSPDLLDELRQRLLRPPTCAPECSSVPSLALTLSPARLEAKLEVHADEQAVVRVPGPLAQWAIDSLKLDKRDALPAARLDDGFLYVRVPPGIHQLELSGAIPPQRPFTLALGSPLPHRVSARGAGWIVDGLHADGTSEASLEVRPQLARGAARATEQALTQWLEVRRTFQLGLRFQVQTQVTRLGPPTESVLVRLPLLPGESVTEAGVVSEDGTVVVTLPRDQTTVSFASTMDPRDTLALKAVEPIGDGQLQRPYSEVWSIRPGPLYRVRFEGIAPVSQLDAAQELAPLYRPWPGETLTVHAEKLEPAAGASVTIDRAELAYRPGARLEQSTLTLSLRGSRGTTERIRLPKDATLSALTIDGSPHPARLKDHALELPLGPGTHAIALTLSRPATLGFHYSPQAPSIARPLTNVLVNVSLPPDRWLLATAGPSWGPAVLFWGYLLLVALIAVVLGRVPLSPLRTHQWLLLGLGLTQVALPIALIVVGWLFALAAREHRPARGRNMFNFLQVLLVGFTLVALACLAYAVHQGLLLPPDMQVQGMMSNRNFVQWYADRTAGDIPEVTVWSAPLWIYKCLMLIWALWLAASLVQWLRWGWVVFRKDGGFRPKPPGTRRPRGAAPPGGATPPAASGAPDSERARVS